jgi:sphingomyelin phosphodiesterase acid-like 3
MRTPLLNLLLLATLAHAPAQTPSSAPTVPILMLSDLHFDPFRDTTDDQLKDLLKASPDQWAAILDQPGKGKQNHAGCDGGRNDTNYALLKSSLAQEQQQLATPPLFITVSGDLITHNFDCKYKALVAKHDPAGLSDFAARTAAFIALELHSTFPTSPVYLALGNNDSACDDYKETEANPPKTPSPYFQTIAETFAKVALDSGNAKSILATFPIRGDYSVLLPKPFANTRLIVLQDLFESHSYKGPCSGANPNNPIAAQIAWLQSELADPAVKHFWVMAHIPTGVDPYSTIHGSGGCPAAPTLSDDSLAGALSASPAAIDLTLYGHTHMDEMRLISATSGTPRIPARLNPSITPWDGNLPSFTVAQVDPAHARLIDFTVFLSPNPGGTGTWPASYTYSSTYNEPDYSAASLANLIALFQDPGKNSGLVAAYQHAYQSTPATTNWSAYVCAITSDTPAAYNSCYCSTAR